MNGKREVVDSHSILGHLLEAWRMISSSTDDVELRQFSLISIADTRSHLMIIAPHDPLLLRLFQALVPSTYKAVEFEKPGKGAESEEDAWEMWRF